MHARRLCDERLPNDGGERLRALGHRQAAVFPLARVVREIEEHLPTVGGREDELLLSHQHRLLLDGCGQELGEGALAAPGRASPRSSGARLTASSAAGGAMPSVSRMVGMTSNARTCRATCPRNRA